MKAVGYRKSLPIEDADSLIDFETAKPEPKGRDVRVAVRAISANPVDYKVRKRAAPPEGETKILGYDAAGIVDATGPDVTLFKPLGMGVSDLSLGIEIYNAARATGVGSPLAHPKTALVSW